MAAVVVLPWAPPTTIDRSSGDELGEELGARPCPRPGRMCAVETTTSKPGGGAGLAADVDVDPVERLHEDRLADVPAAHLRAPARARCSRTRRAPRRRSRRSRSAGRRASGRASSACRAAERAIELLRDLRRRRPASRQRAASPSRIRASRAGSREQLVDERRDTRSSSSSAHDDRAAARARSAARSGSGGRRSRAGYGTRIAGVPAAASSHTVPPAREIGEVGGGERVAEVVGRRRGARSRRACTRRRSAA